MAKDTYLLSYGIEGILQPLTDADTSDLPIPFPTEKKLQISGASTNLHIDDVFGLYQADRELFESLLPDIDDLELLSPSGFKAGYIAAKNWLHELKETLPLDEQQLEILDTAEATLDDVHINRAMIDMYRSLMIQG
ncbi:hypothetical protein [Pleionea sp. CnH1-48]|uniref:type III secretion apparatus assembly protein SctX n=1 Tax=Pleionea sp. CnH1-48 TaxID=2954494 RepID=UPI002097E6BF|nr:hypothetical protein [Pleionea sp. CnH1-48]MCO7226984.1 hypothetical protein [Pleionea sp. CnH1-48]